MTEETPKQTSDHEPTVLDLYKSVTQDWASFFNFIRSLWDARRREELEGALARQAAQPLIMEDAIEPPRAATFPWRALLALLIALAAQSFVEPPNRQFAVSLWLYFAALGLLIWAFLKDEWHLPALPSAYRTPDELLVRLIPLPLSIVFALIAFFDFEDGLFTWRNTLFWLASVGLLIYSLWIKTPKVEAADQARRSKWLWNGMALLALGVSIFFRLYRLDAVPAEPFSDHAEKILDVYDISQGQTKVFFERNTGREAFQMYWTLLVAQIFGTGFSFYSLKLGTALLGILTLPFMYQLGKEFGNKRAGLFALFLFGIAYWPNVISRIGLRFPLYPLFLAPTLLYLTRGLRTRNRNDFILCGVFLGLGLHGYSPFRIAPFLAIAAMLIYLLHVKSNEARRQAAWGFVIVAAVSLFVFLPLFRYWIGHPDQFGYRAFTRLSGVESPLPGPAWQIFIGNMYNGLLMFNWDDGEIWVNSMPHRPAFDEVTAALFVLGAALLVLRYIRRRDWRDLLLLVSIPILLLPSTLSLAFPGENPALNRAGGAAVAGILVGALALEGLAAGFGSEKRRQVIAWGLTGILFIVSAFGNYNIVFRQFDENFRAGAWNTSEMGKVIRQFREQYGQTETVWIVPFPHWVDTRLPGVWAGIPNRDFALWQDQLSESLDDPAPKLFMFWNQDEETERILRELYPNGVLNRYTSAFAGKDFYVFFVEE